MDPFSDSGERRRVVVGVDGSPGARIALATALVTAAQRRAALDVVSAVAIPLVWTGGMPIEVPDADAMRMDAEQRLRTLVDEVRGEQAGVPGVADVDVRLIAAEGHPVPVLLEAAEGADLLVVGSRGRGPMRSALLGSVALHCISHAPCAVLVAHPAPAGVPREPRVVVGIDGSAGSQAALAAAVEEAARSGAEVEAVAAFVPADYWTDLTSVLIPTEEQIRQGVLQRAEEQVNEVLVGRTGVAAAPVIRTRVVEGPAGEVLVGRSRTAQMLVVGSHGRGAIRGLLLGSVALHCAISATAPVTVVRPQRADVETHAERPVRALADG